jgi:hypothetical protein
MPRAIGPVRKNLASAEGPRADRPEHLVFGVVMVGAHHQVGDSEILLPVIVVVGRAIEIDAPQAGVAELVTAPDSPMGRRVVGRAGLRRKVVVIVKSHAAAFRERRKARATNSA